MSAKEKYRELCKKEQDIPIFSKDWWLDTVCGDGNWNVCVVEENNRIIASMPYYVTRKFGQKILSHPALTQTLGPWMGSLPGKYSKVLARQKDIMYELIDQLPDHDHFGQKWHYSITNWLPFYWRGYEQTTRYTYILKDISNLEDIWSGLQENIRREIRKAENRYNLSIRDDLSIKDFLRLNEMTFQRNGERLPYSYEFVEKLEAATSSRGCSKMLIAQDSEGNNHAGVFLVWDDTTTYYLMGGGDPELRNSGATSLCMWEAIKFASKITKNFNFEGSMIEPIERFFRAFGAVQMPYHSIHKSNSNIIKIARELKSMVK